MNQNQRDELRHIFLTRNDDELETVCLIAGQILKERLIKMLEIRKEIEPVEYGNHAEIIDICIKWHHDCAKKAPCAFL